MIFTACLVLPLRSTKQAAKSSVIIFIPREILSYLKNLEKYLRNFEKFENFFWKFLKNLRIFENFWEIWDISKNLRNFEKFEEIIILLKILKKIDYFEKFWLIFWEILLIFLNYYFVCKRIDFIGNVHMIIYKFYRIYL